MAKKTTKTSTKKMLSECKAAFKKICDANGFDKEFFDRSFESFENSVISIVNPEPETDKETKKLDSYIIKTGAENKLSNGVYVHQKGASQKADAASGRSM